MKKPYPSRKESRWEHALTRPLNRVPYEMLELMRADLFEYLDVLTTHFFDDPKTHASTNADIQRVANRLKEMGPYRNRAAQAALKARRIASVWDVEPEDDNESPCCGPSSVKEWEALHRQWEQRAHRSNAPTRVH